MKADARESDCLVIGGGLAGAMAGLRLAAAGRAVLLMERERAAHAKVCGEFLSPEAVGYLRSAGVDPVGLGAVSVDRLRIMVSTKTIEAALPFSALSLSRTVLDEALLTRAAAQGCRVRRGAGVERLARDGDGWAAEDGDGRVVRAAHVFLATGKHDLRGWGRGPGAQNDLVGFELHWRLAREQIRALSGCMELFLFRGGYGGLSLVENEAANLCLVVRRKVLHQGDGWPALLTSLRAECRLLRQRLAGAEPLIARPLAISPIPYGYLAPALQGPWRIGDQSAVIPSFTGDGMAIALHSAALAAEMFLEGASPEDYQRRLAGQLRRGMTIATALSRAMASPAARRVAPAALALLPPGIRWIAGATRIPGYALPRFSAAI
ncbi:MAG TPA: FAD-dependent monooxygenase [Terracidiphilus sp.]|jgi:flavin-dependent dehydrogenase|nr:FAD-dependent monooxygenase [Terracidiphilus sp.]